MIDEIQSKRSPHPTLKMDESTQLTDQSAYIRLVHLSLAYSNAQLTT